MSVDYGQRHHAELAAAKRVASFLGAHEHRVMGVDLAGIGGSALTDATVAIPESPSEGIPVTYVPARNTLLLSLALGWAEVIGAVDIFVGVNAVDYSGYPDCRPEFLAAFEKLAQLATKAGIEGAPARNPRTLGSSLQSGDHPSRNGFGSRLRHDGILLSSGRGRSCLRKMRFLPLARGRLRRRRCPGPYSLSLTSRSRCCVQVRLI